MENFFKRKGKGTKVGYNLMKVRKAKNGQFSITIPKNIALDLKLDKGSVVHFERKKKIIPLFDGEEKTEVYCVIKKVSNA